MSLKTLFPTDIPEETRRVVEPLLAADSVYRLIAQEVDQIVRDDDFREMYAEEGRPGINPVVLALVTVFQFLEQLPDRLAAEMAVMRLDWKYALRQPLGWPGFHYADLCNFRQRLLRHGQQGLVFERLVNYLREQGYLKAGGKQRTDATHVLGAVKRLSRLEMVWETTRVAVGALVSANAPWTLEWLPASFVETYSQRRRDYRLTKEEMAQQLQMAGEDSLWLLEQVASHGDPGLQTLPEVVLLRRMWNEQFRYLPEGDSPIAPAPNSQCRGAVLSNPHDPEACYGYKGTTGWVGYKLQVTESADEGELPRFVTDVAITAAPMPDNQHLEAIQTRLIERELAPAQQYVDQGYMSAANIVASRERGVDLRGLIKEDTSGKAPGFRLQDFHLDIEHQQATCPAGKPQARWVAARPNAPNLIAYHVFFGTQCQTCCFFGPGLCTDKPTGRHLGVSQHHEMIQARRRESDSDAFRQEMHLRAAIEGTISEMVRAHGARRARYRGQTKNQLQALFIATATNLKRLARALATSFPGALMPATGYYGISHAIGWQFFNRILKLDTWYSENHCPGKGNHNEQTTILHPGIQGAGRAGSTDRNDDRGPGVP